MRAPSVQALQELRDQHAGDVVGQVALVIELLLRVAEPRMKATTLG
jgi:hypothetical protein